MRSRKAGHLEPFTPDPTFFYLTGVESPGALLFLARTPRQDMEVLLLPATDPAMGYSTPLGT